MYKEILRKIVSDEVYIIIEKEVNKELLDYLFENILIKYNSLDKGHGINHIGKVIDSSIKLSNYFDVNKNMILTIAVYHDIGMIVERKTHEKHSKNILITDKELRKWFNEEEIIIMGEACEDHRASNVNEPRTIYGYIISDADRTTDINDMIERCYNFSKKNFNDNNEEEIYKRVYNHLRGKYGEGGYAKFYLEESREAIMKPYLKAQEILKNEKEFKEIYKIIVSI
ncbi:HD domain-containing protein [Clostridium isatidis]|uniref:HD domain-containing protein n=1 Tax=Clostridium isatidis TaxID=182773 RepID=UPI003AAF96ED